MWRLEKSLLVLSRHANELNSTIKVKLGLCCRKQQSTKQQQTLSHRFLLQPPSPAPMLIITPPPSSQSNLREKTCKSPKNSFKKLLREDARKNRNFARGGKRSMSKRLSSLQNANSTFHCCGWSRRTSARAKLCAERDQRPIRTQSASW